MGDGAKRSLGVLTADDGRSAMRLLQAERALEAERLRYEEVGARGMTMSEQLEPELSTRPLQLNHDSHLRSNMSTLAKQLNQGLVLTGKTAAVSGGTQVRSPASIQPLTFLSSRIPLASRASELLRPFVSLRLARTSSSSAATRSSARLSSRR